MVLSQCKINRRFHVIWKGVRLGSVKKRRAIKVWIFHNGWSSDVKWHLTRTVIVNNQKLFNWIRLRYFLFHTHPPNWRRFRGSDGSEVQCAIKRGQVHWTSQSLLVQWPFYKKKNYQVQPPHFTYSTWSCSYFILMFGCLQMIMNFGVE